MNHILKTVNQIAIIVAVGDNMMNYIFNID